MENEIVYDHRTKTLIVEEYIKQKCSMDALEASLISFKKYDLADMLYGALLANHFKVKNPEVLLTLKHRTVVDTAFNYVKATECFEEIEVAVAISRAALEVRPSLQRMQHGTE